jgi:drug/metabolite transporter (DMT)-like permease
MGAVTPALRGHLAMLLFSALVAGSFSLGAMVANDISPIALTAVRFAIAAVVIGLAAKLTHGLRRADFQAPWRFMLLGALFAGYFVLMFHGLKTAEPVSAAAVFTLTPVMSGVFGWFLLRQVTTARMALALAIGATGALWVIFRADWNAFRAFAIEQGEVIYFWGCVAHAIYTPLVRKLNRGEPAVVFSFGMLLAGCVVLFLAGWRDVQATDWAALPGIVWITILYLALFASAATFVLLQYASLTLPAAKVMAYTYLTPSWVILWEIALGRPAPTGLILVGIVCTVVALFLLLESDVRPVPANPSEPEVKRRTQE